MVIAIVVMDFCSLAIAEWLAVQWESKSRRFVDQHRYPSCQGQPIQLLAAMETSSLIYLPRLIVDLIERVVQLFDKSVEHPGLLGPLYQQTCQLALQKEQL